MNPLDAGALVLVLVFAIRCAFRGAVKEIMSMAAIIAGALASFLFWKPAAALLSMVIPVAYLPQALAIAGVFILVFILVKLVEHAIIESMEALHHGFIDHILGFILGALEGVVIGTAFAALIAFQPVWDPAPLFSTSIFYKLVSPFMDIERILGRV